MNLLLLAEGEVCTAGRVRLQGRRARHLRQVLRTEVGRRLRVGIVDGPLGTAEVLAEDDQGVSLACTFESNTAQPGRDALLLAVPRPRVLLRILEHAAAMGFGRFVLFRSWRVDKSHLDSRAMDPAVQRQHLLLGLEQGARTRLPTVESFPLFRPFVEDHLEDLGLPAVRFVAHPAATTPTAAAQLPRGAPFALALGPEGGLLPYEVDQLAHRGFLPLTMGPHPLRTESALAALWGQLDLLRTGALQAAP